MCVCVFCMWRFTKNLDLYSGFVVGIFTAMQGVGHYESIYELHLPFIQMFDKFCWDNIYQINYLTLRMLTNLRWYHLKNIEAYDRSSQLHMNNFNLHRFMQQMCASKFFFRSLGRVYEWEYIFSWKRNIQNDVKQHYFRLFLIYLLRSKWFFTWR